MKILITFFPIDDMGGIINHHEQLCAGLKELGHEVTTKCLVWRDRAPDARPSALSAEHSGLPFDQRRGFNFAGHFIPYKGKENLARWKEYAYGFDLIIWQVAVPTKRAENRGNTDWLELYRVDVSQLAVIHDGNFLDSYPWLSLVSGRLAGLACVHTCAFNSARHIGLPSSLIVNPHELPAEVDIGRAQYMKRRNGFLSVQTFKAWKRVPELVAAIPHMGNISKNLAGKGIDYYYLTSKDKCKYPGIWDEAINNDMVYHDVITNEQRDHLLRGLTLCIDASWSKKYGAIGAHFNRVQIDSIKCGAIPVVRDLAIGSGKVEVFRENQNCLVIPWDATPKEFGHLVTEYAHLPYDAYERLMMGALETMSAFDRKIVAQRFIDLALGSWDFFGTTSDKVHKDGLLALGSFFNDKS